jgi:uncharacterized membrane protein YphA (DoxX/SURF4 family)
MEFNQIGRWLIYIGIGFITAGLIFWLISKITSGKQFPGTLNFQIGGLTCTFPLLLSIVLSIVLTVILNVIARLINH